MCQVGEACDRPSHLPPKKKRRVKIRITLFFDGTQNNRRNISFRLADSPEYRRRTAGDGSYDGAYTNVAMIERLLDTPPPTPDFLYIHVYTEGIGTVDGRHDVQDGLALGTGSTGIKVRVEQGVQRAVAALEQLQPKRENVVIEKITVDTCGFSRGAAAARHCVHRVLHDRTADLQRRVERLGYEVAPGAVVVAAVGLFDTVSSYVEANGATDGAGTGAYLSVMNGGFANDVAELHLDAIRDAAAVYQLAAAEEYRTYFALTDIRSAGKKGMQVYLPGAHSDIGGGYREGPQQAPLSLVWDNCAKSVAQFLLRRGWYRGTVDGPEIQYKWGIVYPELKRLGGPAKPNNYPFIPMRLMAEWLRQRGIPVSQRLFDNYTPDKVPSGPQIERLALAGTAPTPEPWEHPEPKLNQLRYERLHISFDAVGAYAAKHVRVGTPNGLNYSDSLTRPYRILIPG